MRHLKDEIRTEIKDFGKNLKCCGLKIEYFRFIFIWLLFFFRLLLHTKNVVRLGGNLVEIYLEFGKIVDWVVWSLKSLFMLNTYFLQFFSPFLNKKSFGIPNASLLE